jgi:hypothetical protein
VFISITGQSSGSDWKKQSRPVNNPVIEISSFYRTQLNTPQSKWGAERSPETSFLFFGIPDDGKSPKKPIAPSVSRHYQNPLEKVYAAILNCTANRRSDFGKCRDVAAFSYFTIWSSNEGIWRQRSCTLGINVLGKIVCWDRSVWLVIFDMWHYNQPLLSENHRSRHATLMFQFRY